MITESLAYPYYPDEAFASPTTEKWPIFRTLVGCNIDVGVLQRKELYKNVSLRLEGLPNDPHTEWKYEMATTFLPMISVDGRWLRHLPKKISFTATNMGNDTMHLHLAFDELSWEGVDHFTGKRHQINQGVDIKPGETFISE